jgi:sugar phosphate isomerase/epimerase
VSPSEPEEIMSTTAPSFEEYDFDRGDHVRADWTDGDGPLDAVVGTVTEISCSGGNVIVAVEADDDQYPDRSIYGGTHDCAPEWVELL